MQATPFQDIKQAVSALSGASYDALHIHIGLFLFLALVLLLRLPLRSIIPLLIVLAVALLGEAVDLYDDLATGQAWRWRESLRDLFDTLLWPGVLWLSARLGLLRCR